MWTYSITDGKLYDKFNKLAGKGYSGGNLGKNPEGMNNPEMESVARIGPIPAGYYTIGPPFDHPTAGPFVMRLSPDAQNVEYGRGGFLIHGDTELAGHASEGCIVMSRPVRQAVAGSDDNRLQVMDFFSVDQNSGG